MKNQTSYAVRVALLSQWAFLLLLVSGCHWMSPQTTGGRRSLGDTASHPDSLARFFEDYEGLKKENAELRARVKSADLDIAKLRAEHESQLERTQVLEDEIQTLAADLQQVEKQFVNFEQSIQAEETKASAVTAIADAQVLFEKVQSQDPDILDSLTVLDVTDRLRVSNELVKRRKFTAAVYYAHRVKRILNLTERRKNIASGGETRIVSVGSANIREGPGQRFRVVGQLKFGTPLVQVAAEREWYKVRTKAGETGWVHGSLVR